MCQNASNEFKKTEVTTCPLCEGDGFIQVIHETDRDEDETVECPMCFGNGRIAEVDEQ